MKLFGNSKGTKAKNSKKSSGSAPAEPKQTKKTEKPSVAEGGKNDLIGMLASRRIKKAKAALDSEEHRRRSPEERARIEAEVEKYQRGKVIKRLVALLIVVVLAVAAVVAYKVTIVPPDISKPSKTPSLSDKDPQTSEGPGADGEEDPVPSKMPISDVRQEGMYTFLLVGNDQGNGNTDTLIVGRMDTVNHKLNLVSIPRDTLVNVSWPVKKVNTIQAFNGNGVEGLVDGLSDLLGFEVDSYVSVNLAGFKALVQAIGGVYFDVPQDMKYWDPTQNLNINVSKGYQLLTPEQAEGVVRYRSGYAAGDIRRIEVQQAFLMALAKQCLSMSNLAANIDDYAEIFKTYVNTDLSLGNIVWYAQEFLKLSPDSISFETLPANYNDSVRGLSYCTVYLDRWTAMINSSLNPYVAPVNAENLNVLTRDASGNLYATTGTIAGGLDSFYNNIASSTPATTPEPSPEPTPDSTPEATPGTSAAPEQTPGGGTDPAPEKSPEPSAEPTPEPSTEPTTEPSDSPWDDENAGGDNEPQPSDDAAGGEDDTGGGLGGGSPADLW